MPQYSLRIDNIHCPSCEQHVRNVINAHDANARVKFLQNRELVRIDSTKDLEIPAISAELHQHGFDLQDENNEVSYVGSPSSSKPSKGWLNWLKPEKRPSRAQRHAEICEECHDPSENAREHALDAFRAVFAVSGMTCAGCSQSIVSAVKSNLPEVLDVSADPLTGAAYVLVPGRDMVHTAEKIIDDAGFSATLTEVLPISATDVKEYRLEAAIGGMTCSSCSNTVKATLESLPSVTRATVEVLNGHAEIFTKTEPDLESIRTAVEDIGYDIDFLADATETHSAQAAQRARTVTLRVSGIFCERCPDKVMDNLKAWGNAVDIVNAVSMATPYVKFTYLPSPPSRLTIRSILARLEEANPELEFEIVHPKSLEEIAAENQIAEKHAITRRLKLTSIVALPTALLMFSESFMMNWKVLFLLSTPIYFFAADIFHRKALKELRMLFRQQSKNRLFHFGSMNLLMSLGTSISYFSSVLIVITEGSRHEETYFDSVIFLTFFLLIGRYLDIYSKIKTTSAVSMISKVRPDAVALVTGGSDTAPDTKTVNIDLVEVGDKVAIFSGQRCAVDGVVINDCQTEFNESMLTGESLPVPKGQGDEVYAGTLNAGQQSAVLRVTAVGKGTLLDDIVDAVRDGQMQRAPIENLVEQITSVFVPIVVYLALTVWLVWYIITRDVRWSMQFAIATFVVACPCGIGLAAPTALYIGSGISAKYGILARGGGEAFEEGAHIDVICFDKTGTITRGGELRITDTSGAESDDAVQLAAILERDSTHPLASAIIEYAKGRKVADTRCGPTQQIDHQGRGVRASVLAGQYKGETALLGNEQLIKEAGCTLSNEQVRLLQKWKNEGKSVVLLAIAGKQTVLMFAFADQIRPESRRVVHKLHLMGIQCWMISGDNVETAQAVGRKVGIPSSNIIAGVLPQQKADKIRSLQMTAGTAKSQYGRALVAMVGDGINDAPALSASDVGVALGRGADIALSSSQFVLLREDLSGLPVLCEISQAVMSKVRTNFFWAAFYNLLAIPVAAGLFYPWTHTRLDPVWASLAMALSSVSVMTSSLLLRRFHPSDSAS